MQRFRPSRLALALLLVALVPAILPASEKPPGELREVGDMTMHVQIRGEGQPLLLLHGFTGAGSNWDLLFPEPPPGFRLIIPDLRGHGWSTNPSPSYTHGQAARDVLALLDQLGIESYCAIGFSGGAMALLHMASLQPQRIEAMVLTSSTTHYPESARQIMASLTAEGRSEADWATMRSMHSRGDQQILALWRQGHAFRNDHEDMSFSAADLAKIRPATLLIHGDRDPLFPPEIALAMYRQLPDAYLWLLPNSGHETIFAIDPKFFRANALGFLQSALESR